MRYKEIEFISLINEAYVNEKVNLKLNPPMHFIDLFIQ
jgi:hypothetical protein